ncbi:MAG: hypothetical protein JSS81_23380 [Acidobacteria bacterium]|nr:hypothetical protein [Acidobacteriota bacterium]
MIDTFQVSRTQARAPVPEKLDNWQPLRDNKTGEPYALCFNSPKGEHKPRLTITKNPNEFWIIRAEVSPGSWLFNSNLHLVNEAELDRGLHLLSEYVEEKTGVPFDAHSARVTRVDFTRDFDVGENNVIPFIAQVSILDLQKYKKICFDNTSVYFRNAGKELTKQYKIYSKYHERLANSKDIDEQERAKGIVRLEVSFRKSGVNRLAESLGLQSHCAEHVLTKDVSDKVIERAMKVLEFEKILKGQISDYNTLFQTKGFNEGSKLLSFLFLKAKLGNDYEKFALFGITKRTCQRYWKLCKELGVLSLE